MENIHHFLTSYDLPQYQQIFDGLSGIVFGSGNDASLENMYYCCVGFGLNFHNFEDDFPSNDQLVYCPPLLDEVWLNKPERHTGYTMLQEHCCIAVGCEQVRLIIKPCEMY